MTTSIEGFYAAYLSGADSQGFAMLVFTNGRIVGVDIGAIKFDGSYTEDPDGEISIHLDLTYPPNIFLIQGGVTGPQVESSKLNFRVPRKSITEQQFFRVETPRGPVNAKLVKLRDFDNGK